MHLDSFSGLDLLVALDVRNIEAHLTGTVEKCAACATVSGALTTCPAGRATETAVTAPHRPTATEIIDRLTALCFPMTIRTPPRLHAGGDPDAA